MSSADPFAEVIPGTLTEWACSPQFDAAAPPGLLLNAPREADFPRVVICGAYSVPGSHPWVHSLPERLSVVATDDDGRLFFGACEFERGRPRRGSPRRAPASWLITGYFNIDLAETLVLPPTSTSYFAYVFAGGLISNVVRVRVKAAS